jgi:hypothetical protein
MCLISLLKQDDDADQKLSDDASDDSIECTLLSDLEEDDLDHQQAVLLLGQACHD